MSARLSYPPPDEWRPKVTDLPPAERPTNRLYRAGPDGLSTTELLACVLGTARALDDANATLAVCDRSLARLYNASREELTTVNGVCPAQSACIHAALELGRRMSLERHNTASIVVAHSHPSGHPTPSPEDVAVTCQLVQAGNLLDVEVMDHLYTGRNRLVSLRERGLRFNWEAKGGGVSQTGIALAKLICVRGGNEYNDTCPCGDCGALVFGMVKMPAGNTIQMRHSIPQEAAKAGSS